MESESQASRVCLAVISPRILKGRGVVCYDDELVFLYKFNMASISLRIHRMMVSTLSGFPQASFSAANLAFLLHSHSFGSHFYSLILQL